MHPPTRRTRSAREFGAPAHVDELRPADEDACAREQIGIRELAPTDAPSIAKTIAII